MRKTSDIEGSYMRGVQHEIDQGEDFLGCLRPQAGFKPVFMSRYSMSQFVGLVITLVIMSSLAFFTLIELSRRLGPYNELLQKGILTRATITKVDPGSEESANAITYRFKDKTGRLVTNSEDVGRKVAGKLFKDFRPDETIEIMFLEQNPSISRIAGNTQLVTTLKTVLAFFIFIWCLILFSLSTQVLRIVKIRGLYMNGTATKGTVITKRQKKRFKTVYGLELAYLFKDGKGLAHTGRESTCKTELLEEITEGSEVTVLYREDKPGSNTILMPSAGFVVDTAWKGR
jgi:hypothetical protein